MIFMDPRLDYRIDRAGLFAKAAINALEQVDVVAGRAPCAIGADVRIDRNGERRTYGLAQLAGNAALLAVRIAAQRMEAAKAHGLRSLFFRIVKRDFAPKQRPGCHPQSLNELAKQQRLDWIDSCHERRLSGPT